MSSQSVGQASNSLARPSVYQNLIVLHESNDPNSQQASLEALPKSIRQKIFHHVALAANRDEVELTQVEVLESRPRLQEAVHAVAMGIFHWLPQNFRNAFCAKAAERFGGGPQDLTLGEKFLDEHPYVLLSLMHVNLGDQTPELLGILNHWVKEPGTEGEEREKYAKTINVFLRNSRESKIVLGTPDPLKKGLTSFPRIFDKQPFISRLKILDMVGSKFQSLPSEIGRLQNLETVYLLYNQRLQSLPPEIGQLQNLKKLELRGLCSLHSLPNELLNLPKECQIDLTGSRLSARTIQNLREACEDPDYNGPSISYSMEHLEDHNEEHKDLFELVAGLYTILGEAPKDLTQLRQIDQEQGTIRAWISRLSYTADYQSGGELQQDCVRQILNYLEQAEEDPQFRDIFLAVLQEAAITCGDRVSLSILHVDIVSKLQKITDVSGLAHFLIRTVWPVQMLEGIAREKIKILRFFDEVEVYLAYPLMLKNRLSLDVAVEEMLYFSCSALKEEDLDQAAVYVEERQKDKEACSAYLSAHPNWMKALQKNYPEQCEKIAQKDAEELEAAGDDPAKLNQLEINRQERWKALTEETLISLQFPGYQEENSERFAKRARLE